MNIKFYIIFLFQILSLNNIFGTIISGKVVDEKNEPLPFVSVYLQGTTRGTTTNIDGVFAIDLEKGSYDLLFQYVGYKTEAKHIEIVSNAPLTLNVQLSADEQTLREVTIKASGEDPAYRIIRQAIKNRKAHLNGIDGYACDVYIKGNQKIKNAPKGIMGRELGDFGGGLDSSRSGIVYLSESVSKLYYKQPDEYKELMVSSKVAGNANGFSFNQAQAMDFNIYKNKLNFQNDLVSPIADGALSFYKYALVGQTRDKAEHLISKIKLIPRNEYAPVFRGFIYIIEDDWSVFATEIDVTKNASGVEVLDTLHIRQQYLPQGGKWLLFNQKLEFNLNVLNIKIGGLFTAVYNNYTINPNFPKGLFSKEILTVEKGSNEKNAAYWDAIRPIPLTLEEKLDYTKKDSLQLIRNTKRYLDSTDRRKNRLSAGALLLGYTHTNTFKNETWSIASPITTVQFNPVQGWNLGIDAAFRKGYDKYRIRWWRAGITANYGFSEQKPRVVANFTYHFNRLNDAEAQLSGGEEVSQFNANAPISPTVNTIYALYENRNYMQLYNRVFVKGAYAQEVWNGGYLTASANYCTRYSLYNTTEQTWYKGSEPRAYSETINDRAGNRVGAELSLRVRFNQSFIMYPERKISVEDEAYPTLYFTYKLNSRSNFVNESAMQHIAAKIDYKFKIDVAGTSNIVLKTGYFIFKANYFADNVHFNGNQTILGNPNNYLEGFKLLPYYQYSVADGWQMQAHYEHDFAGFLWNKLPLLKRLKFTNAVGANFLKTQAMGNDSYYELNAGISNIGWGLFRLLRIDYVVGRTANAQQWRQGVMIGLRF